jgi:hypothetical protein
MNDERPMTKHRHLDFVIRISFVIQFSTFVIPRSFCQVLLKVRRSPRVPLHLQAIVDLLHTFNAADDFLRHLFLKERPHYTRQDNPAVLSLKPQMAAAEIGVEGDGSFHALGERGFDKHEWHLKFVRSRRSLRDNVPPPCRMRAATGVRLISASAVASVERSGKLEA